VLFLTFGAGRKGSAINSRKKKHERQYSVRYQQALEKRATE